MEHHQDIAGAQATKEVLRAHQVTAGAVRQATAGAVRRAALQATAEAVRATLQVRQAEVPEAIAAVAATAAEEEAPAAVVAEAQDASNKQFNKYNYEKDGNYTFADDCRSIRICPDSI
jgi:hypothetical protein